MLINFLSFFIYLIKKKQLCYELARNLQETKYILYNDVQIGSFFKIVYQVVNYIFIFTKENTFYITLAMNKAGRTLMLFDIYTNRFYSRK